MAWGKKGAQSPDAAAPDGGTAGPAAVAGVKGKAKRRSAGKKRSERTDAKSIKLRENMAEALEYRKQGYSYREISELMKRPISTLQRWVSEAVKEITEEKAETIRNMMLKRLDDMMTKAWARIDASEELDVVAVDTVLRLDDRRARMLGLYNDQMNEALQAVGRGIGHGMVEQMRHDPPVLRIEAGTPIPALPKL